MRIKGIAKRFPYFATGIALLKKKDYSDRNENLSNGSEELQNQDELNNSSKFELIDSTEYQMEREV